MRSNSMPYRCGGCDANGMCSTSLPDEAVAAHGSNSVAGVVNELADVDDGGGTVGIENVELPMLPKLPA